MAERSGVLPQGARVCIVGGGTVGILAAKCALDEGFIPTVFERAGRVGGVWRRDPADAEQSPAYDSLYTNSSRALMAISNFPWSVAGAPDRSDFPMHWEICEYYDQYVDHYSLRHYIQFQTEVVRAEPPNNLSDGRWRVVVRHLNNSSEEEFFFSAVMVCTGQFSQPSIPSVPGMELFQGRVRHSHSYKNPSGLPGKRVVVVGLGNSALDISLEAAQCEAASVHLVVRSGVNILPVSDYRGLAADTVVNSRFFQSMPASLRGLTFYMMTKGTTAAFERAGMPKAVTQGGRISNLKEHVVYRKALVEKRISIHQGTIERFQKDAVLLSDGKTVKCDEVIFCTGYRAYHFPFLAQEVMDDLLVHQKVGQGTVEYLNLHNFVLHPHLDTICFAGQVLTLGNESCVGEMQVRWAMGIWSGTVPRPSPEVREAAAKKRVATIKKLNGNQNNFVMYISYMDRLAKDLGVEPPSWYEVLLRSPRLAWALLMGPAVPTQYRIAGRHAWPGAEEFVASLPATALRIPEVFIRPPDSKGAKATMRPTPRSPLQFQSKL